MKKILLLFITFSLYHKNFAQPFLHELFPMGVCNAIPGDTFLNKRDILKELSIKKVISYQHSDNTISTITRYINKDGAIDKLVTCTKVRNKDINYCHDFICLYDNNGRISEERFGNADSLYTRTTYEYSYPNKVKQTVIYKSQKQNYDTSIQFRYYNERGQLIKTEYEENKYGRLNATLFYNKDGLLDGIKHEGKTTIQFFKRYRKGKNMLIQLDEHDGTHIWTYNSAGQCISKEWKPKKPSTLPNGKSKYYYNPDATLSKVTEVNGKRSCTTTYSYEK